jgi:hypothetical protein
MIYNQLKSRSMRWYNLAFLIIVLLLGITFVVQNVAAEEDEVVVNDIPEEIVPVEEVHEVIVEHIPEEEAVLIEQEEVVEKVDDDVNIETTIVDEPVKVEEPVKVVTPPVVVRKTEVDERPSTIRESTEPKVINSVPTVPSTSSTSSIINQTKASVQRILEQTKSKLNALVKRIQNMDQNDAKKVAAATLGVWGVTVGVGWLAKAASVKK